MFIYIESILVAVMLINNIYAKPTKHFCQTCKPEMCSENPLISCCKFCLAHIKCSPNEMVVTVPKAVLPIPTEDMSFADEKCGGWSNDTHHIFITAMNKCGTKSVFIQNTHILYKNEIRHRNGMPVYALTCLFKRRVSHAPKKIRIKTRKDEATRMYHTSVRGRRQHGNTVYSDDNDYFFFEIKGPSYLRNRKMQMAVKSCQFDITENSNTPGGKPTKTDVLIKNGCPTRSSVQTLLKTKYTLWFSVYIDNVRQDRNDTAVLNCDVVLCNESANQKCIFKC